MTRRFAMPAPGSWRAEPPRHGNEQLISYIETNDEQTQLVAMVYPYRRPEMGPEPEHRIGNADLMAAAPDLYGALQLLLASFPARPSQAQSEAKLVAELSMARARGENQNG